MYLSLQLRVCVLVTEFVLCVDLILDFKSELIFGNRIYYLCVNIGNIPQWNRIASITSTKLLTQTHMHTNRKWMREKRNDFASFFVRWVTLYFVCSELYSAGLINRNLTFFGPCNVCDNDRVSYTYVPNICIVRYTHITMQTHMYEATRCVSMYACRIWNIPDSAQCKLYFIPAMLSQMYKCMPVYSAFNVVIFHFSFVLRREREKTVKAGNSMSI